MHDAPKYRLFPPFTRLFFPIVGGDRLILRRCPDTCTLPHASRAAGSLEFFPARRSVRGAFLSLTLLEPLVPGPVLLPLSRKASSRDCALLLVLAFWAASNVLPFSLFPNSCF